MGYSLIGTKIFENFFTIQLHILKNPKKYEKIHQNHQIKYLKIRENPKTNFKILNSQETRLKIWKTRKKICKKFHEVDVEISVSL